MAGELSTFGRKGICMHAYFWIQVYNMLEFLVKSKEIHTSKVACLLLCCGLCYCYSQVQRSNYE